MRSSLALAAASLVAGAYAAHENATVPAYTTEVVTEYTTYCPEPTSIVHKNETYTVTAPTTLTITNCPYTVTKPLIVSTITTCDSCPSSTSVVTTAVETSPGLVTSAPVETAQPAQPTQPAPYVPSASPPLYTNGTVTIQTLQPTSPAASASGPSTSPGAPADASTTSPALPAATGAANRAFVASGAAALAGLVGLAAYML